VRARREALFEGGAFAVFVVADDPANWSAMRRQIMSRPIVRDRAEQEPRLEGSMSSEFAVAMITSAGLDWDKLRLRAKGKEFAGENLGVSVSLDVKTEMRRFSSHNVIGSIKGRKPGSGAVLFLGHWDHLGLCQPPEAADRICNGAVDNASGIAMLSEIARSLAKTKPDRDIYFLATTAEESGLLGAYAFTENPPFPLKDIVVAFNLDTVAIAPAGKPVATIGRGLTELDPFIDAVIRKNRRKIEPSLQANAFVRRQDGWALSKSGIPSVMIGGAFADNDRLQKFLGSDYHGPKDELSAGLDLSGAVEDAQLHVALGRYFSSTRSFKGNKSGR
jgi:Zn-dependent M28 family amino/carboxypeptidase